MTETTGSRYFRLERFRSVMRRHLATSGRFDGACLTVDASVGGFLGLLGATRVKVLQIDSASDSLFESGWEDISVRVFDRGFFHRAKALAEDYEQLTQQTVTLFCYFELEPGDAD